MPHWARKKDATHVACAVAFRRLGYSVMEIWRAPKCVDLVVAKHGRAWIIEVKAPGEKLTPEQAKLLLEWQGPSAVVESVEDVLALNSTVA